MRAAMKDFCFTVNRYEGKERLWFGDYSVSINRNIAFNFFPHNVRDDESVDPYPVIRGDRTETPLVHVSPVPDDPSADFTIPFFYLAAQDYRALVETMEAIRTEYVDLRLLPDTYFEETILVRTIQKWLAHPTVKAERGADWPSLLSGSGDPDS